MSDNSKIEWTDATWNPVTGCTKVSPGCDHCYAERVTERFHGPGSFADVQLHPARLDQPLRWRRPRKVFVNSMSDLFHEDVPDDFIARVWAVMAAATRHKFQVLTRRHGRMRAILSSAEFLSKVNTWRAAYGMASAAWPLPNVWLGISVENQKWADIRIPALLNTPAASRFVSAEPLLGPVNLTELDSYDTVDQVRWKFNGLRFLDWVIVGGESGPAARSMHPDWARSIRDQCVAADVPFLFKQWGEWAPGSSDDHRCAVIAQDGEVVEPAYELWDRPRPRTDELNRRDWHFIHRPGKRAAGRELDGQTWGQYPDTQPVPA